MTSLQGHGALGLRYTRDFIELMNDSAGERRLLIDLLPAKKITGWSTAGSGAYGVSLSETHDGIVRDVWEAQSLLDGGLAKVESLTACQSVPGTFFYDINGTPATLYVHLNGDYNANDTTVLARFGFYVSTVGRFEPLLGVEQLTYGGLDVWLTSQVPEGATPAFSGGTTLNQDVTVKRRGAASGRFDLSASSAAGTLTFDTLPCITGNLYRFSGSYMTGADNPAALVVSIRIQAGSTYMDVGGRDDSGDVRGIDLTPTYGEWRRFCFDYYSTSGNIIPRVSVSVQSGTVTGSVWFDDISHRPIHGFHYVEPVVGHSNVPNLDVGSNDIFFGGKRVGGGQFDVINLDGTFNSALRNLLWIGQVVRGRVGGRFSDGSEVSLEDYRARFRGTIKRNTRDRVAGFAIDFDDARNYIHRQIPAEVLDTLDYPDLERAAHGKHRGFLIGDVKNITPYRLGSDPDTGFGIYEIAYTGRAPNGIKSVDQVVVYADQEAVKNQLESERIVLEDTVDYDTDLANGQILLLGDMGPYIVEKYENDYVSVSFDTKSVVFSLLYQDQAYIITPANGATISGSVLFQWSEPEGATSYWLSIGSTAAAAVDGPPDPNNLYYAQQFTDSVTVPGLPGTALYAAIWTFFPGTGWTLPPLLYLYNGAAGTGTNWTPGIRRLVLSARQLAQRLQDGLNQIITAYNGTGTVTVSIDQETHKCTIVKSAGTLTLHLVTANDDSRTSKQIWKALGFTSDEDLSGALTYESNESMIVDQDPTTDKLILRVNAKGYKDDAVGTYTGTADALIELGPDIVHMIWVFQLSRSTNKINLASFVAARSIAIDKLGFYLGGLGPDDQLSTQEIFTRIEYSCVSDLIIDGDGVLYFNPYNETAPTGAPVITESEILSLQEEPQSEDIYSGVTVLYAKDGSTGTELSETFNQPAVGLTHGRLEPREFPTFLISGEDVVTLSEKMAALAAGDAGTATVTVRGILLDSMPGDIIKLTLGSTTLDTTGVFTEEPFRIIGLRFDDAEGTVEADLVTIVPL